MKHLRCLLLVLLLPLLSGCTSSLYQVASLRYDGPQPMPNPATVDHERLQLRYHFWGDGGYLGCEVHNPNAYPMVVDLSQSSLIIDGQARPYVDVSRLGSGGQALLTIPPQASISLTSLPLGYTVTPGNKLPRMRTQQELADPPGFSFRHYLTYHPAGQPDKAWVIDNPFTVASTVVMGSDAFQQQTADPMRMYAFEERVNPASSFLGVLLVMGAGGLWLHMETRE